MAPHFSSLHFIDIRENYNKKDLLQLIESVNPDLVLMMYWPSALATRSGGTDVNPYELS